MIAFCQYVLHIVVINCHVFFVIFHFLCIIIVLYDARIYVLCIYLVMLYFIFLYCFTFLYSVVSYSKLSYTVDIRYIKP